MGGGPCAESGFKESRSPFLRTLGDVRLGKVIGSKHAWAASAAWVGTVFSFLPFHLITVYFGFLEKTSWKSVVGKVLATCFSFEICHIWVQWSYLLSVIS